MENFQQIVAVSDPQVQGVCIACTCSLSPSVCGRSLTCLASAADSKSRDVVEAVRRSVQSRMAVDPLIATPSSTFQYTSDTHYITFPIILITSLATHIRQIIPINNLVDAVRI